MTTELPIYNIVRSTELIRSAAVLGACLCFVGCSTGDMTRSSSPEPGAIVQASSNFDGMLKQNQMALLERKGPPDVALYNIGLILCHPSNPKKDQLKALHSFKTLIAEHPRSQFVDQAKTWIHVLELQYKNEQDRQRLLEEKRALSREREMLAQERQKLNFTSEKSRQIDLEIEKRRRQSLSK